jgi:DNA ligase (NAD+)
MGIDMSQYDVTQLVGMLDKADNHYYRIDSKPIMTDEEYDRLKSMLRTLSPDHPRLQQVGLQYNPEDLRNKVKHTIPMGSLDNTEEGITGYNAWYEGLKAKIGNNYAVMASLKIDGASICASYKAGVLTRVATRGNGEFGDDITINAANFRDLPTKLYKSVDVEVRGEAILYKEDFDAICERDSVSVEDRSNPRNVGNGILGRDDGKDTCLIRFIAFNIECESSPNTEAAKYKLLNELGFKSVPHLLCEDEAQFNAFYNIVANGRDKLPFEIDGVVACVNQSDLQELFVTTDSKSRMRPKYARAVKFPHKSNITTIIDVIESVGHTRAIVPTAVLEEVRVGGVNVKHALLNNYDEIRRLGLAIGDKVEVILAGDVIPKIIRKVSDSEKRVAIIEPTQCPTCGSATTRKNRGKDGAVTYCSNANCESSRLAKVDHWIGTSKTGVGILGIGDGVLSALWGSGLVKDPADLYVLTVDAIKDLDIDGKIRIGLSRAKTIIANIEAKKSLDLPTFLGSLGIDLLGRRRVRLLMQEAKGRLDTIEQWLDEVNIHSLEIQGLGDAVKTSLIEGIRNNKKLISKLIANGVTVGDDKAKNGAASDCGTKTGTKPFEGLSFCLTGTRAYIKDIESLGGEIKNNVSKDLSFLVQADPLSVSSKTQKAESYGIPIISVEYLKEAINGKVSLNMEAERS